jgi:hypothetical protein
VEKPHLVPSATCGNVEASFVPRARQSSNSLPLPWGRYKAEEHDITFITLKGVRVAADQASPFHLLGTNSFQQSSLNQPSLILAKQADDSH